MKEKQTLKKILKKGEKENEILWIFWNARKWSEFC